MARSPETRCRVTPLVGAREGILTARNLGDAAAGEEARRAGRGVIDGHAKSPAWCGALDAFRAGWKDLAERVGFEPTIRLHVYRISSPAHSTTLPPLRDRSP